ncbi:MAG: methyltransferase domain-containing protein [Gammaproteobacteria bacterium]|nr:methyltransferase domain-containing protein [Gammaproteobacteria bacterium]
MSTTENKKNQYFGKDLEAMSFAKNYHQWIVDEFSPYLGNAVAEVGGGIGDLSKLILKNHVNSLKVFEPSQNMFPSLVRALNHDNRVEAINDYFGKGDSGEGYDSVLYINVLEHIENDKAELVNSYNAINPKGHLLIFVPALPWLYSEFDKQVMHFRRYLKKDLVELTTQAGFTIVKARYFDFPGILPWYVHFVLLKNTMGSEVSLYDKLVVPPTRFIETLISPPIGKNILLVARKD